MYQKRIIPEKGKALPNFTIPERRKEKVKRKSIKKKHKEKTEKLYSFFVVSHFSIAGSYVIF
jgi:hypothetical protein